MTKEFQNLNEYRGFVNDLTSDASKNIDAFQARITELHNAGADVPRLLTAAIGMSSEGGEFSEIVKKIVFQGKEYNHENVHHMRSGIENGNFLKF